MKWRTWMAALVVLSATAAPGEAQQLWDVAGVAGLFTSHSRTTSAEHYDDEWFNALQTGVVAGRYLTRHVKLEVEASTTTRGSDYRAVPVSAPGGPFPNVLFAELRTAVRSVGGSVAWQFRENEWVHPFVHAGLSVDWDDAILNVPPQIYYGDPRGSPIPVSDGYLEQRTTTALRGVVGGGAKLYFSERAFVRTEARLSWGSNRQNLALRGGIGIDF